ncbi:antitoxin Xre-like helix-turn-helix domain-containing protein [uncultured Aquincola sp.]|uniref:antitoxin Xre-like helix-turn-helix domain-containing protein n=1 Tax=uncultured Aquincola sp. TaxID=886556 RepID=UPI0032B1206B
MRSTTVPAGATRLGLRPALRKALAARQRSYRFFVDAGQLDRIGMVKQGLPATMLTALADDMSVPRERLYAWLGIARATANRKIAANDLLSQDESERALGIARLVGQVEKIVAESGTAEGFDAARWTAGWLDAPNAALGGRPPGDFMDTADGRALVTSLVEQMQSGAYA